MELNEIFEGSVTSPCTI